MWATVEESRRRWVAEERVEGVVLGAVVDLADGV